MPPKPPRMVGGGADLLDSPKKGENSDFESPENDEKTEEYTVTYKTYNDYFTDLNISKETITSDDFVGTGSEANPFVVRSIRGLLYLTRYYNYTSISLDNKYLKLDCDIVLNEEKFDEDGNPSGGDGVVYEWSPIGASLKLFDGQNHTISGMWKKTDSEGEDSTSFFKRNKTIGLFKDVKFENVYVENQGALSYNSVLAYDVKTMENVDLLSGTFKTKTSYSATFCVFLYNSITNCNNYVNVYTTAQSCSGMVCELRGIIANCNNYGNITSQVSSTTNGRVAGLVVYSSQTSKIIDCTNYGNICTNDQQAGGICVWVYATIISGCKNYGEIEAGGFIGGGIAGSCYNQNNTKTIYDCQNYGKIIARKEQPYRYGEIIGSITVGNGTVHIVNCEGSSSSAVALVGTVEDANVSIKNSKVNMKFESLDTNYFNLILGLVNRAEAHINNLEINVDCEKLKAARLFTNVKVDYANVHLKNIIINLKCKSLQKTTIGIENCPNINIDGLLLNYKIGQTTKKEYYGIDFSGFYSNWKSGKIGLKALDGSGFMQTTIDKDILESKGYKQIVV